MLNVAPHHRNTHQNHTQVSPHASRSEERRVGKESKCPSTDELIKKLWFIYTMEYYVAMRKNEIWPFVAMWMELKSVMLSEISHTEKDRYYMFSLLCGS